MQRPDIGRDVTGFEARQIHIRHFGVRIEQKCHETQLAEVWPLGNVFEGRGISIGLALSDADDMTRSAPPLYQPLAVKGVSSSCGAAFREGYADGANHGDDERNADRAYVGAPSSHRYQKFREAAVNWRPAGLLSTRLLQTQNISDNIATLVWLQDDVGHPTM